MVEVEKLKVRANDPTLESVRFLYEEFKPNCFMFMVYEVSRRIFLTGCLAMFLPDSISQIAIGLLGSLMSYRVFSHYTPYVERDEEVVSEVAQTQLVLVFFYALMVFATDNLDEHDSVWSGKVFASLLVVLFASTLLIAIWLVIVFNFSIDEHDVWRQVSRSLSRLDSLRRSKEGSGAAGEDVPVEASSAQAQAAEPVARV